jgi:hypothetical protein
MNYLSCPSKTLFQSHRKLQIPMMETSLAEYVSLSSEKFSSKARSDKLRTSLNPTPHSPWAFKPTCALWSHHAVLRMILLNTYRLCFYLDTNIKPVEMSTENGCGVTQYLFYCDPILCIIVLEGHLQITTSLNRPMHNANLKFSGNTAKLSSC